MSHVPPGGPQQPFGPPGMPPANPYAPQGPPGSYAQPPAQSGTPFWLYGLGAVGLFFMCCCGGCFLIPFFLAPDASAAYTAAADTVKSNAQVMDKLGTPLTTGFPSQSQVNLNNNTGDASFTFTVTGPQGEGTVRSQLVKENGQWKPTMVRVTFDDNTKAEIVGQ